KVSILSNEGNPFGRFYKNKFGLIVIDEAVSILSNEGNPFGHFETINPPIPVFNHSVSILSNEGNPFGLVFFILLLSCFLFVSILSNEGNPFGQHFVSKSFTNHLKTAF
ncbi:MAG: hypothetical protein KDK90_27305, partial [Leptospiraceae bacterium]|nr:hypothetical protein [Leptospiraceae bacterium]